MERLADAAALLVPMMSATALSVQQAAVNAPIGTAVIGLLAVVAAFLARSAILIVPNAILAALALLAMRAGNGAGGQVSLVLGILALAILCAWTLAIRRSFSRLRRQLRAVIAERAAAQELLDREIAWRQAAQDNEMA